MKRVIRPVFFCLLGLLSLTGSVLLAQGLSPDPGPSGQFPGGTWVNFESQHCKPIAVARLGSLDDPSCFLLVCNTADDTLEIFDINGPGLPVPVTRVPVGQDPVSVIWHEEVDEDRVIRGRIYTANAVGDSVSMIDFSGPSATATLLTTENVGDEPVHLAYDDTANPPVLFVSLMSRHAGTIIDANTLAQLTPDPHVPITGNITFRRTKTNPLEPAEAVIDSPRTILLANSAHPLGGTARFGFVLGAIGTHHDFPNDPANTNTYFESEAGFDLFFLQFGGPGQPITGVRQKLGTRNFNMTVDAGGAMWVVSGDAANRKQKTKASVNSEPTGFVRTLLHLIPTPAIAGSGAFTRDLNRQTTTGALGAVITPTTLSLSHATDVAVYERGDTYKVYVTALNNNAVGVIGNVLSGGGGFNTNANTWARGFINLDKGPGTFAGPSSLAIKYDPAGSDSDDRIFVLNRFHNSVDIIDPNSDTIVGNFPLQTNPEPAYIRAGREFLYGVKHGNDFNACEGCHHSGRLDKLRWDLSDPTTSAPFSMQLIAHGDLNPAPGWCDPQWNNSFNFSAPKGEFITQSLQGLVNFEVKQDFAQDTWFSNKPYHWDMDQAHFSDFNGGGFQVLLGGNGLSVVEMQRMIRFINSIHYPPNKEQAIDRVYRGEFGNPSGADGSQAQLGMKMFHFLPAVGPLACVHCHTLPEGSNNLGTVPVDRTILNDGIAPVNLNTLTLQSTLTLPLESAAMRGLPQKETIHMAYAFGAAGRYQTHNTSTNDWSAGPIFDPLWRATTLHLDFPLDGNSEFQTSNALTHNGNVDSINDFVSGFSAPFLGNQILLDATTQFCREFDTGVAPAIGQVHTITAAGGNTAAVQALLEQVRSVNVGVAAYGSLGGTQVGFFYMPSTTGGTLGNFINVVTGASTPALTLLGSPAGNDILVFEALPLGMARRKANPTLTPVMATGPAPSNLALETMVPNRAYESVPSITFNWDPFAALAPFVWIQPVPEPWDMKSLRLLQSGYLPPATVKHHEPPRRFRVSGEDIRPGAILRLWVPMSLPDPEFGDWYPVEFPIFPSDKTNIAGNRIWETAVEADGQMAGIFAMGGYWSQGVHPGKINSILIRDAVHNINEAGFNPSAHFNRASWNAYMIEVVNEDGTSAAVAGQPIDIEPPGFVH